MRLSYILFVLISLSVAASATAQELASGQVYQAGSKVTQSAMGVSVPIPAGWTGEIKGNFFVLSKGTQAMIALRADQGDMGAAKQWLSSPQDLGNGFGYAPKGEVSTNDGVARVPCTIAQGFEATPGEASIKVGRHGFLIVVIATAPEAEFGDTQKAARQLVKQIKLGKPATPKVAKSSGKWADALRGRTLNKYGNSSTVSSKTSVTLCSDGTFTYYSSSSGHTETAPGESAWASHAGRSSNSGKWSVIGSTLKFTAASGESSSHSLAFNEAGNLLVDGERWLRIEADGCD